MSESTTGARTVAQVAPGEGTAVWFTTDLYVAKLISGDTDGAFTVFEVTAATRRAYRQAGAPRVGARRTIREGETDCAASPFLVVTPAR